MGSSGPEQRKVDFRRDVQAEDTLFGTAERGREFLGQGVFDQFQKPLRQLSQALGGQIPASALPIANTLRQESLQQQSTALRDVDARSAGLGGNKAQTGVLGIAGQLISDFARDRSQIPARVISDVIRNFLPIASQQATQQQGINQSALTSSGGFNPISGGRAAQQQNQAAAAQPPEQKSGAGAGQLAGVVIPALLTAFTGGAAAPLLAGSLANAGSAAAGINFGGRNASGSFFG